MAMRNARSEGGQLQRSLDGALWWVSLTSSSKTAAPISIRRPHPLFIRADRRTFTK